MVATAYVNGGNEEEIKRAVATEGARLVDHQLSEEKAAAAYQRDVYLETLSEEAFLAEDGVRNLVVALPQSESVGADEADNTASATTIPSVIRVSNELFDKLSQQLPTVGQAVVQSVLSQFQQNYLSTPRPSGVHRTPVAAPAPFALNRVTVQSADNRTMNLFVFSAANHALVEQFDRALVAATQSTRPMPSENFSFQQAYPMFGLFGSGASGAGMRPQPGFVINLEKEEEGLFYQSNR